ncbi:NB-ARC domain-containing protein [Flavobacterium filum]|uniref:NB-ARC domain-containing protein n=1 Tax=Flavobacterium filum TaxID=370974 RepID=UPI0023F200EA|nr:NB-ARC domain-containing protein [Flavobacterium filum]
MIREVKIILYPEEHKSKNGVFFEDLMRSIFSSQGYVIEQNINFTGLEIDIFGTHQTRTEKLIVECKAKQKPKSTEIKNFIYNVVLSKKADYGYFVHTEELDHQASALRDENLENPDVNKKISFLGPTQIIDLLVKTNKIKFLDIAIIPKKENIHKIILAYTYFGVFYIVIPYIGSKKKIYYLFDAETGLQIDNVKKIASEEYSKSLTLESALKSEIDELSKLQFFFFDKSKSENNVPVIRNFSCDYPLELNEWVGRKKELENISPKNFNIIFITGIGGQGKSALASYYIQNIIEKDNNWEYWDWRDLKEEGNRLHTKIISIIERLTNGEVAPSQIKDENLDNLLEIFFHHIQKRRIVFVFDNIDNYIDLEEFKLTEGLNKFYNFITRRPHACKFIFTCRPFVMIADLNVYQIRLQGLTEEETTELFLKYQINIKTDELTQLSKEVFKLTNGHPQWIKLFIGQAFSGKENLVKFIETIKDKTNFKEDNLAAIFSQNILDVIWITLNTDQKFLLRSLAELVKAETQDNIGKIINSELNFNHFHKSIRRLKRLNLIVTKSLENEIDQLELHPLVKEFILQKYPLLNERSKFITFFVNFYNNAICVLRKRLSWKMSFNEFEQWTSKVELEVNNQDFKSALITLHEVEDPLLTAGYLTEYIRVAEKLFSKINWQLAISEEFSYFHEQAKIYFSTLTETGNVVAANDYLVKYSHSIQGKGAHYLIYCEMNCYHYWFIGSFENAIKWGERIIELKKDNSLNAISYSLALAWRDSNIDSNIDKAINYFLEGTDLKEILEESIKNERNGCDLTLM